VKSILLATIVLAGCNQQPKEPVGRYQAVASNNERHEVFVLDTQTGDLWSCSNDLKAPITVVCGVPKGRPR